MVLCSSLFDNFATQSTNISDLLVVHFYLNTALQNMFESFDFKFNYSEKQSILLPTGIFTIHSV